jgi:sugar lactone lactonase YvrE
VVPDAGEGAGEGAGGGWLAGVRDGFGIIDAAGDFTLTLPIGQPAGYRLNDGAADAQGNVWAGSVSDVDPTKGTLYRLDGDGTVTAVREDLAYPNGIAFSADGSVMTLADSEARSVEQWSIASAELGALLWRRQFAPELGIPDGVAIDTDGGVWVAMFGSGLVIHCSAAGDIDDQFSVPVPNPTSVVFGGQDYGDLYITTARFGMTEPALAMSPRSAGGIFHCRPGTTGFPPHSFTSTAS